MPFFAGTRLLAADLNALAGLERVIVKAADQLYLSDNVLRNDTELVMSLAADSTYQVEFILGAVGQASSTGDIQTAWTIPSGATGSKYCYGPSTATTDRTNTTMEAIGTGVTNVAQYGTVSTTSSIAIRERGFVTTTSAGTLTLQHAQITSNANSTGIRAGSIMVVRRVVS